MTAILLRHFRLNPGATTDWMHSVRSFEAKRAADAGMTDEIVYKGAPWKFRDNDAIGESSKSALKLTFVGNRVDLIPGSATGLKKLGSARILIDGSPPTAHPELYAFTLPSPAFGADYQPGIRCVESLAPLQVEDWVLRITATTETWFSFEVIGSKTGADGSGTFQPGKLRQGKYGELEFVAEDGDLPEKFISNSKRVVIEYRDLKILWGQERARKPSPVSWEIRWRVVPKFVDTYTASPTADPALLQPVTLAQGLSNSEHTVEIVPIGDGAVPIREIVVHRPPLGELTLGPGSHTGGAPRSTRG